ncbi:hypothetical protein R6Q59_029703 [Mikania micrantha]
MVRPLFQKAQNLSLVSLARATRKDRYMGIWFMNTSPQTVVWVANRETPLTDNSGAVKLDNQGNLTLVNGSGKVIWSSNSSASGTNINLLAQLLDTGNLVIKNGNEVLIWQSFDYPGDTYLPEMKLGKNFRTGRETYLTSWRSSDDPSPGEYTFKLLAVKGKYQQVYIRRNFAIETRIGSYNGKLFSGRPEFALDPADPTYDIHMVVNPNEMYFTYTSNSTDTTFLLRTVLSPGGKLEIFQKKPANQEWIESFTLPVDYCDNYGVCGPYGSCNTASSPYCGCLKGFERKNTNETSLDHNDTSVCRRSIELDCGHGDGFLKFSSMKLPDTENAVFSSNMSLLDCEVACKNNCSCTAYANPNITSGGVGCLLWFGDLIDVRVFPQNGQDLYVRLAASELSDLNSSSHIQKRVVMVVTLPISVVLTLLGLILALYIRRNWKKKSDVENNNLMRRAEVSLFGLSKIQRATNNFSVDNKLGEGGFGPVYKGVLEGQEIAVKRLSKSSQQGLDEFKNEVICIAKLQHRNLVKLFGYCIQADEKMLIYEYMPNSSLDTFLFDDSRKSLLAWSQRFLIIHGIARGLLYLHQDSRLKVVHRDLKAGNILLDHLMHPKISDFGLAKMFKENESEANTKRVVGTLGYISPEYATNGLFSIKTDIFSFGVLVLEIVSRKKNRRFVDENHDNNLLGHAWRLYKEGKSLDLIDECLRTSYSACEVLRAVHVGLLCVQQRVEDRPDTQTLVGMLGGEGSLPSPKKPAFFIQESEINSNSTIPLLSSSINEVTKPIYKYLNLTINCASSIWIMNQTIMFLSYITFFLMLITCRSSDTISVHQNISDGDTIVSGDEKFELGFFSPGNSKSRYLGIWYKNTLAQTVAWVANRETPVTDNLGAVKLDNQGNLTLVDGSGKVIWSSNSSDSGQNINLVAQLLDTGNLVIKNGNENLIWQSFDYPGDTFLPGMKMGKNFITGRQTHLTSWRSADDPSPGEYTSKISADKGKYPQSFIMRGSVIKSRTGLYNGKTFSGQSNLAPDANPVVVSDLIVNQNEIYVTYISKSNTTTFRSKLTPDGKLETLYLKFPNPEWMPVFTTPVDYCDNYGVCGPYGSCTTLTSPNCGCLKGFELKNLDETSPENDSRVCRRKIALDCGPGEIFLKFSSIKLPDTKNAVFSGNMSLQDCEVACKNNCSCTAYANPIITPGGVGCLVWFGDLIDVRVFPQNGQDLYVRLAASELSSLHSSFNRKKQAVMAATLSTAVVLTLLGLILAFYTKRKWKKRSDAEREGSSTNQMRSAEVPLFRLSKICRATNDFSNDNKLGEGGFGPVYKGVLEEGQEIAVKRLSKSSRQGLDEFKNEVICIAKLQHRNLVKLLGYCIQGDEKMLIYEYLSNKSLDYFLFDESRKSLLDWPQRFQIIQGIARGVLYLHQDSRLKVVHRDLKAGNILLDHQMFPKIADFGLARMFRENESEANTKRVVGTLGYISPEYAVNGLFSLKSDIFSFGVLVLEIVSGKKNRGFVHEDHEDNLLGHAWRLFKKGKSLDLIDECLHVSYSACEVSRSIHVGLLCVQQRVEDRPNTSIVVGMLGGEGSLPSPKKPAFYIQESEINSTSNLSLLPSSVNELTFSQVDGR